AGLKERTTTNLSADFDYTLNFIVYGKTGVMGEMEPLTETKTHEIGIVIDAVADSQEHANAVCAVARSTLLHYGYPGRIATAGNLAFPFSPSDIKVGPIYVFSIYALLRTNDPVSLFKCSFEKLGE
ncbi:MAG: 3-methylaspartate ammonia-lyase, partial [Clostridia bacterium]|nr:3-methylaspartate ammonia-lyase [Clostridia bacterium]